MLLLDCRDHVKPILCCRLLSRATSPSTLEDRIEQQHCHVATHAVALAGNVRQRFHDRLPKPGIEDVELQHIRPCREVGVPPAGEDRSRYLNVGCGIVAEVGGDSPG